MKKFVKILSLVFALCLSLSVFGCNLGVQRKTPTDVAYFNFVEIASGEYEISVKDINNLPTQIILPSTYNGGVVTSGVVSSGSPPVHAESIKIAAKANATILKIFFFIVFLLYFNKKDQCK